MNVWWRKEPLTQSEGELLDAVFTAHYRSSFRANPSSSAVETSAIASDSYTQSIAAALAMLGGKHAPLTRTYDLLAHDNTEGVARELIKRKIMVPGWGSDFQKNGEQDDIWLEVETRLQGYPVYQKIKAVNQLLSSKKVHPNPSAFTAATGIALGTPRDCVAWIFVAGRLSAWSMIANAALTRKN